MSAAQPTLRSHSDGGPRCSTASRALDEPLSATASPGRRWLLVEIAGAWGWNAFLDSPALDRDVGRRVVARAEAAGMRIAAIRRPGRARTPGRWRWMIVDTAFGDESIIRGECGSADELLSLPLDGSVGVRDDRAAVVVCAHGRHDRCCAIRGRSAALRLADAHPDATWECSHIGGDRFAATMIVFPHGLTFGRVDSADPAAIVNSYLRGEVQPEHFRGRTTFDRPTQAADLAAREWFGDDGISPFRPLSCRSDRGGWVVELDAGARGTVSVAVDVEPGPSAFTMCEARSASEVPRYRARRTLVVR